MAQFEAGHFEGMTQRPDLSAAPSADASAKASAEASATPAPGAGRRRGAGAPAAGDPWLGPGALAFPTERALLLRVALPLASQRRREAAVGFAVEDLIGEPLEAVHVALGPELGPGEYLAAVVGRDAMADWAPRAQAAGLRLVPDALGLPVPPAGSWSALERGGRVLVRRADGAGFATRSDQLEAFWRAAGSPQLVLFGGRLPAALPQGATGLAPAQPVVAAAGFDLLQGAFAPRDAAGFRRTARRLAAVAALALGAHLAILAAETSAALRTAEAREAAVRDELALRVPGLPATAPLDAALRRALPEPGTPGGFLPLLAAVAEALAPRAGALSLRSLDYDAATGALALLVEAPDLATLQAIESDLAVAGLPVAAGVATTADGGAEVRLVVGGAGG